MTDRDWTRQIAAVHPDRGGSHEACVAMVVAREQFRKTHRKCLRCGKWFPLRNVTGSSGRYGKKNKFCRQHCAVLYRSAQSRHQVMA